MANDAGRTEVIPAAQVGISQSERSSKHPEAVRGRKSNRPETDMVEGR
jgi:hypothetical protein